MFFIFVSLEKSILISYFSEFDWVVVNRTGDVIPFVDSASNGLVVTSVLVPPVMYISAPSLFLGTQFRSYGQRLHVKVRISRWFNSHGEGYIIIFRWQTLMLRKSGSTKVTIMQAFGVQWVNCTCHISSLSFCYWGQIKSEILVKVNLRFMQG